MIEEAEIQDVVKEVTDDNLLKSVNQCAKRSTVLGKILYDHRIKNKYSLTALSKASQIKTSFLSSYELEKSNDKRNLISIDNVIKLSQLLNIDSDILFEESLRNRISKYIYKCYETFDRFLETGKDTKMPSFSREMKRYSYKFNFKRIGKILQDKRFSLGFEVIDVAKKIGRSKKRVGCIERGENRPSLKNMQSICEVLQLDFKSIYRLFVQDSVETWKKLYSEEYYNKKNNVEICDPIKNKEFVFQKLIFPTKTRDYFIYNRAKYGLTKYKIEDTTGISVATQVKFEQGTSVFNFWHIFEFAKLFQDNVDILFQMSLEDSELIFRSEFTRKLDRYLNNDEKMPLIRYPKMHKESHTKYLSPLYLTCSSFLRTEREKLGISKRKMATKIGMKWAAYNSMEIGKKSITFLIMEALEKICSVETKVLYEMYLNEHVAVWKNIYSEMWKKFLDTRGTNNESIGLR